MIPDCRNHELWFARTLREKSQSPTKKRFQICSSPLRFTHALLRSQLDSAFFLPSFFVTVQIQSDVCGELQRAKCQLRLPNRRLPPPRLALRFGSAESQRIRASASQSSTCKLAYDSAGTPRPARRWWREGCHPWNVQRLEQRNR